MQAVYFNEAAAVPLFDAPFAKVAPLVESVR